MAMRMKVAIGELAKKVRTGNRTWTFFSQRETESMKITIAALLASLLSVPAMAQTPAERFANVMNTAGEGKMHCGAKSQSKTILCIVNASDGELRKLAGGIVFQANAMDIPLSGWKLQLVNFNDYVVSRRF